MLLAALFGVHFMASQLSSLAEMTKLVAVTDKWLINEFFKYICGSWPVM